MKYDSFVLLFKWNLGEAVTTNPLLHKDDVQHTEQVSFKFLSEAAISSVEGELLKWKEYKTYSRNNFLIRNKDN